MASIQIGMLGPAEAIVDSTAVTLGATKQRAVLAMLALNANRAVSVDRLTDGCGASICRRARPRWSSSTSRGSASCSVTTRS